MTGSCRVRVTVSCRVRVAGRVAVVEGNSDASANHYNAVSTNSKPAVRSRSSSSPPSEGPTQMRRRPPSPITPSSSNGSRTPISPCEMRVATPSA
ncbi:hypothetical protein TIFTF001_044190 [Ficus carica]|uniref:Uncharacterized protein n=1 Tax=Ficus carica TaxID=3494 RepID=A0AA87Z3N7_FICCA|nr:hypothetical protein TIFTF001_044190 [Ficus carica]